MILERHFACLDHAQVGDGIRDGGPRIEGPIVYANRVGFKDLVNAFTDV
jgi:hypothetical protein